MAKFDGFTLSEVSAKIAAPDYDRGAGDNIFFGLTELVSWTLPHKPVVEEDGRPVGLLEKTVSFGGVRATFSMSSTRPGVVLLPYGMDDRVLLDWLLSRAVSTGNPVVEFDSPHEYLEWARKGHGGRAYNEFRESWKRVSHLMLTATITTKATEEVSLIPVFVRTRQSLIDNPELGEKRYRVEFAPQFYKEARRLPMNIDLMRFCKTSCKSYDMGKVVQYCAAAAYHKKRPWRVTWSRLIYQLGTIDSNERRVKSDLQKLVDEFARSFPEFFKIKYDAEGVMFYPTEDLIVPPLVSEGTPSLQIPFMEGEEAEKPKDKQNRSRKEKTEGKENLSWMKQFYGKFCGEKVPKQFRVALIAYYRRTYPHWLEQDRIDDVVNWGNNMLRHYFESSPEERERFLIRITEKYGKYDPPPPGSEPRRSKAKFGQGKGSKKNDSGKSHDSKWFVEFKDQPEWFIRWLFNRVEAFKLKGELEEAIKKAVNLARKTLKNRDSFEVLRKSCEEADYSQTYSGA